jgi:uncharacterized protein YkwD
MGLADRDYMKEGWRDEPVAYKSKAIEFIYISVGNEKIRFDVPIEIYKREVRITTQYGLNYEYVVINDKLKGKDDKPLKGTGTIEKVAREKFCENFINAYISYFDNSSSLTDEEIRVKTYLSTLVYKEMKDQNFDKYLLEEKKEIVIDVTIKICIERNLSPPFINFEGCNYEKGGRLAHYHPEYNMICISKRQLELYNFDVLRDTVAHEVTLVFDNNSEFIIEPIARWKQPPGVIVINGNQPALPQSLFEKMEHKLKKLYPEAKLRAEEDERKKYPLMPVKKINELSDKHILTQEEISTQSRCSEVVNEEKHIVEEASKIGKVCFTDITAQEVTSIRDDSYSEVEPTYGHEVDNGVQEKKVIPPWHYKIKIGYLKIKDKIKEFPKSFSFSKIKKKRSLLKTGKDYNAVGFSSSRFYDPKKKTHSHYKYYNFKRWFFERRHPYSQLRLGDFTFNIGLTIGLILALFIVLSYFENLNNYGFLFTGLGIVLVLALLYFIAKYFYKALINLKYGIRGLTNGAKLILIIFLIIGSLHVYQVHPNINTLESDTNILNFIDIASIENVVSNFTENITEDTLVPLAPSQESFGQCERLIYEKTNAERKAQGLRELTWDSSLAIIAQEHSMDMAQNKFFSHTNLNGEDPTMRAIRHGYNVRKELAGGWYSEGIAENIGEMPTGNVIGIGYVSHDPESIATAQVQSWMGSPGHIANILDPQYDRIGVGVAYDGFYYLSTQDFY